MTAGETSLVKQACFGLELGRGFNLGSSRFCASGLASCQPGPSWGNSCAKLGGALQRWGKAWKPRRETQPPLNREARSWLKNGKLGDYFLQPLNGEGQLVLDFFQFDEICSHFERNLHHHQLLDKNHSNLAMGVSFKKMLTE